MNKSSIPNLLTFSNMVLGIISIIFCFNEKIIIAVVCILIAALIDRFDGKVARKLDAVSIMGKELDSLSDMVSFGLAPALLAWKISLSHLGVVSYIILIIFPLCGAFRLARFNVTEPGDFYMGMPITVAGSIAAIDSIIAYRFGVHGIITAVIMVILSYLMISTVKFKKI